MPRSHANTQRRRQILSQNGDLFNAIIDTPCAGTASGEESHITLAKPPFFVFLGGDKGLTGDDDNRLVLAVVPIEASGGAFPNRNGRRAVMAFREHFAARFGSAIQDPIGRDRGRFQIS